MQRLQIFLVLVSSILWFPSKAQNDSITKDSIIGKAEFGLNITPFAVVALGSNPAQPKFAFLYRSLKDNSANRLRFIYESSANTTQAIENSLYSTNYLNYYDSTMTLFYENYNAITLMVGLGHEWTKARDKYQKFYGVDFLIGMKNNYYGNHLDSLRQSDACLLCGDVIDSRVVDEQQSYQPVLGLELFYGFKIPVTERVLLSLQTGGIFKYTTGTAFNTSADLTLIPGTVSFMDFDLGVITDFSVIYRF